MLAAIVTIVIASARALQPPRALAPPPGATFETLSDAPRIYLAKNVFTRAECDALIRAADDLELTQSNAPAAQLDASRLVLAAPLILAAPIPRALEAAAEGRDVVQAAVPVLGAASLAVAALAFAAVKLAETFAGDRRTSGAARLDDARGAEVASRVAGMLGTSPLRLEAPVLTRQRRPSGHRVVRWS